MRTVVYVDGQNFLYKVAEVLVNAGIIADKQELDSINIPLLLKNIFPDIEPEIRFYGVKKIRRRPDLGEEIHQKSIKFSDNLRRIRNYLNKINVKYIEYGNLKVRDSDRCKNCNTQDSRFQEKGVDVGIAVDMVRDALLDNVDDLVLLSSDTDLIPAILVAKEANKQITYVGFEDKLTKALIARSDRTQVLRDTEVIAAYKNR